MQPAPGRRYGVVSWIIGLGLMLAPGGRAMGQEPAVNDPSRSLRLPHTGGSRNVHLIGRLGLGYNRTTADIEIEQELVRPYVYLPRRDFLPQSVHPDRIPSKGVDIVSIKDPRRPTLIYSWRIEQQELHLPPGGLDNEYFKLKGRYYDVQSFQFQPGGPDTDLGAVVLDVTSLPDTSGVKEAGRLRVPEAPGGSTMCFRTSIPTVACCCSRRSWRPTDTSTTWRSFWPARPTRD